MLNGVPPVNPEGLAVVIKPAKKPAKVAAYTGSEHDECDAKGLALAARLLARTPTLVGYAANTVAKAGKSLVLAPSKKNPDVRRWVKIRAMEHLGDDHTSKVIADRLHTSRAPNSEHHPTHPKYWHNKHKWVLDKLEKEHGINRDVAAHAMAYLATRHKDATPAEASKKIVGHVLSEAHRIKRSQKEG